LPINKYLTYNKGIAIEEATSFSKAATLDDYHGAFKNLSYSINPKYNKSRHGGERSNFSNINIENGLEKMSIFFGADGRDPVSKNPYDVAMRDIYKIKNTSSGNAELTGEAKAISEYIETGQLDGKPATDEFIYQLRQRAFSEIVKDDAKVLEYKDLASVISTLDWKMNDYIKNDSRGTIRESAAFKTLEEKRNRAVSLRQVAEESLAYKLEPFDGFVEIGANRDFRYEKGVYVNNKSHPIVVRDGFNKEKIKEIIPVGGRNFNPIGTKDRMLLNGQRYELTNGETHLALEVSDSIFNTENGWEYRNSNGEVTKLNPGETKWLLKEYLSFTDKVKQAYKDKMDGTKQSIQEYAAKRLDLLNELFSQRRIQESPAYQEALVAIFMTPGKDRNVIGITPYKSNLGGGVKLGQKFYETKYNKVIFQYLSQLSNNRIVKAPMDSSTADAILENFITLKKLGMYSKLNGIDINLNGRRSFATQPNVLLGHLSKDKNIGIGVFEQLRIGNKNAREAASVLVDYANGERLIDSATMYKASKVLERAGIDVTEQFVNTKYITSEDKFIGTEKIHKSPLDRNKHQNLGEHSNVNQTVGDFIKKSLSCFK